MNLEEEISDENGANETEDATIGGKLIPLVAPIAEEQCAKAYASK